MEHIQDIPQHPESPGKVRYLTPEEEQKLMNAARLQSWVLLPLLIRLAVVTGLRRGALLGLRWGDVVSNSEAPHVVVQRTKNGDPHVSPITPDLVEEFRRMRRVKTVDSDLIFVGKHAALAHDLGERVMKREYFSRRGELTWDERFDLSRHPILGEQAAAQRELPRQSQLLIRWHHDLSHVSSGPSRVDRIPLREKRVSSVGHAVALTTMRLDCDGSYSGDRSRPERRPGRTGHYRGRVATIQPRQQE